MQNRQIQTVSTNKRRGVYVEGNTVRRYDTIPEKMPAGNPAREREERKEQEKIRRARQAAKANQQRAMQMSPGYVFFLTTAVFLMLAACTLFLKMQSEVNHRMNHIAALENEILTLKTDNDVALNLIESRVDLEEVKNIAITQLGMVYPAEDQIVYFQVDEDDYMNQYQDIPKQ